MKYIIVTNPVWANLEKNVINCNVDFINLGIVPFSANPLDISNPSSLIIYDQCIAGEYGVIADYVPSPPPQVSTTFNKKEAESRLFKTDWVNQPDVYDNSSTLYLKNRNDFLVYRLIIRNIIVNPVEGELEWPVEPTAIW
jgi:hypothetical protein